MRSCAERGAESNSPAPFHPPGIFFEEAPGPAWPCKDPAEAHGTLDALWNVLRSVG